MPGAGSMRLIRHSSKSDFNPAGLSQLVQPCPWLRAGAEDASAGLAEQLHAAVAKVLAAPDVKERYATLGMETVGSTPAEFERFMADDLAKWGRVIKELGITAEG